MALDWPIKVGGSFSTPSPINATLGEYRDTAPGPHFHNGVDISAGNGTAVYSILAGKASVADDTVSVASASVVLSYVHISPVAELNGKNVAAHQLLGHVAGGHLHLTEQSSNSYQNSLRASGGLTGYTDNSLPQVWDVKLYDLAEPGLETPLGAVIPPGVESIVVIARALDKQDSGGSQNTGVYEIGYKIIDETGQVADNGFSPPRQSYSSILTSSYEWPYHAYDTESSKGVGTGSLEAYYYANNNIDADVPVDVSELSAGSYRLYVLAKDIKGHGANIQTNQGADYKQFYLCTDCTIPEKAELTAEGTKVRVTGHTYADSSSTGYIAVKDADGKLGDPIAVTPTGSPKPGCWAEYSVEIDLPEEDEEICGLDREENECGCKSLADAVPCLECTTVEGQVAGNSVIVTGYTYGTADGSEKGYIAVKDANSATSRPSSRESVLLWRSERCGNFTYPRESAMANLRGYVNLPLTPPVYSDTIEA